MGGNLRKIGMEKICEKLLSVHRFTQNRKNEVQRAICIFLQVQQVSGKIVISQIIDQGYSTIILNQRKFRENSLVCMCVLFTNFIVPKHIVAVEVVKLVDNFLVI
jgi:hypothetical protein